jgi:2-oxoglutarate dehydrogenase E1 component
VAGEPIRGAGAAIVANMERSLTVPTATSFRNVPARLLEVNRQGINAYMVRGGMGKVSFTHLIGYAIVRAIADAVPAMNNSYVTDEGGAPQIVRNASLNMGLAVDVSKADGSRTLVVPVLRDAGGMTFAEFLNAYEELIRKVKTNKLAVTDFQGATITLTNPGTIGTVQSVPRLMPGQGVIVGVGSIDYPAEFQGADERMLSKLGISKVVTVTSTYDHRIIQGAESGLFLKRVNELLVGEHGFYDDIFASLGVPYKAERWRHDNNVADNEDERLHRIPRCRRNSTPRPTVSASGISSESSSRVASAAATSRSSESFSPRFERRTAEPSVSSTCTSRTPKSRSGSRSASRECSSVRPCRRRTASWNA